MGTVRLPGLPEDHHGWWHVEVSFPLRDCVGTLCGLQLVAEFAERTGGSASSSAPTARRPAAPPAPPEPPPAEDAAQRPLF